VKFPAGKLPLSHLTKLLATLPSPGPDVIIGPRAGEDAAAVTVGDEVLVIKGDPITFTAERMGWYAVNINANDVACLGARPRWLVAMLMVPERLATEAWIAGVFDDLCHAASELDIAVVGGHTEITPGLDNPILAASLTGTVARRNLIDKRQMRAGDTLLLARPVAIEGTAIMAAAQPSRCRTAIGEDRWRKAVHFSYEPGIGIMRLALAVAAVPNVTALHDPTEGGVLGAIYELLDGRGLGGLIDRTRIPIWPETKDLCRHFAIDPLRLIASGSLLIAVRPDCADTARAAAQAAGAETVEIGTVLEKSQGIRVRTESGGIAHLAPPGPDEIIKILEL